MGAIPNRTITGVKRGVDPREVPPRAAKIVGHIERPDIWNDNRPQNVPIYEEQVTVSVREPETDPHTGEQVWQINARTGMKMYPRFRKATKPETVRYTLHKEPSGNVRKNYLFGEDPETVRRQAEKAERERFEDALYAAMKEGGFTPEELIAAIKGSDDDEPDPPKRGGRKKAA